MKKFSKISRKALSCILAASLVLCPMTTTLSVFAEGSAVQAVTAYRVKYGSPAIPMFKGTVIDLNAVDMQFAVDGDFIKGENITWKNGNEEITYFVAAETGITEITADAEGETSKTVYVIVNEAGDYDFILEKKNMASGYNASEWIHAESRGPENNTTVSVLPSYNTPAKNARVSTNYYPFPSETTMQNGYTQMTASWRADANMIMLKSEILKDFADYTIETTVQSGAAKEQVGDVYSEIHYNTISIIARADVLDAVTENSGISIFTNPASTSAVAMSFDLQRFGGLSITGIKNYYTGTTTNGGFGVATISDGKNYRALTSLTGDELKKVDGILVSNNATADYVNPENNKTYARANEKLYIADTTDDNYRLASNVKTDVRLVLEGKNVIYQVKTGESEKYNTVLDTTKAIKSVNLVNYNAGDAATGSIIEKRSANYTTYATDFDTKGTLNAGTVGFTTSGGVAAKIYSLTVKLNVEGPDDMPMVSRYEAIVINPNSPAIGMYKNTQIGLGGISITLSDGVTYLGVGLNFELANNDLADNVFLNNTAKTFAAFETGVYKLSVANNDASATANLYLVVNENGDNDFYLVNEDFSQGFDKSEWILGFPNGNVASSVFRKTLYATSMDTITRTYGGNQYTFVVPATSSAAWDGAPSSIIRTEGSILHSMGVMFYKSDVLADFADYTIEYDTVFRVTTHPATTNNEAYYNRVGVVARADIDYQKAQILHTKGSGSGFVVAETDKTSFIGENGGLALGLHKYSGLQVQHLNDNPGQCSTGYYTVDHKYFATTNPANAAGTSASNSIRPIIAENNFEGAVSWADYNKYNLGTGKNTVSVKLSGQDIVYKLTKHGGETVTVLDTENASADIKSTQAHIYSIKDSTQTAVTYNGFKNVVGNVSKGTVGIMSTGEHNSGLYNFKVKLNDTAPALSLTPCTREDCVKIDFNSPAVGMRVNTKIELEKLFFELGEVMVSGDKAQWVLEETINTEDVELDNTAKTFTAFETGIYKLQFTYGNITQNIYVMVNEEGDNEFYLVNEDTVSGFDANKWVFAVSDGNVSSTPFTDNLYAISSSAVTKNTEKLFEHTRIFTKNWNANDATFGTKYPDVTGNDTEKHLATRGALPQGTGAIFYKSEMLKDFADYTVELDAIFGIRQSALTSPETDINFQAYKRLGLMVRADVDYNSVVSEGTAGGAYFTFNGTNVNGEAKTSVFGENKALALTLNKYSGLHINKVGSSSTGTFGVATGLYTAEDKYFNITNSGGIGAVVTDDTVSLDEYRKYNLGRGRNTISIKLDGNDILYTLKKYGSDTSVTVLDTANAQEIKTTKLTGTSSVTAGTLSYEAYINGMGTATKGTVGITLTGDDVHSVYGLKVKPNNIVIVNGEACYNGTIPVNNAVDLSKIEELSNLDFTIADTTTARYILEGEKLIALSSGVIYFENSEYSINVSAEEDAKNTFGGKQFADTKMSVYKTDTGYSFSVPKTSNIIPGSFAVTIIDENAISKYTTVNGTEVEYLDYTVNNTVYDLSIEETVNETDVIYSITYGGSLSEIEARAEFAENTAVLNGGIYEHSQQYYDKNKLDENKGYDNALYFLTAIPAVKKTATGGTEVSGKSIEKIGTIFIPSALLGDVEINQNTVSPSQNPNNVIIAGALSEGTKVEYSLSNATNSYYTLFEGSVTDIPDNMKNALITAVTYIQYTDGTFLYGEAVQNSYRTVEQMAEAGVQLPKGILSERQYQEKMEQLSSGDKIIDANYSYMSAVNALTDRLRDRIVYDSQDVSPATAGNTTYYVSPNGNDQNDGTSPSTAWQTLARARQTTYVSGDVLLLERGGEYRGWLNVYDGMTIGAYGKGEKPRIICARTAESLGGWVATETPNVWKLQNPLNDYSSAADGSDSEPYQADLGHVVFYKSGGEEICGDSYRSLSLLNKDYDFYYEGVWSDDLVISEREDGTLSNSEIAQIENKITKELYIYYSGNPNNEEIFSSIELPYDTTVIRVPTVNTNSKLENVTINNLFITHGRGPLWVGGEGGNNICVSYCTFGWHGGFASGGTTGVRYGGGSGVWKNCENFVYDSCWFYQQFDAGVTPQFDHGAASTPNGDSVFKNFITKNCLFETTEYTFEYFDTLRSTQTNGFTGMDFSYNICLKGGCGFGVKPERSAYVKSWQHENTCFNAVVQNRIAYNVFDRAASLCLEITGKTPDGALSLDYIPNIEGNIYIEPKDKIFAKINNISYGFNEESYTAIENLGIETGAKYVYAN